MDRAAVLAGSQPDYGITDLFEAIAKGDHVSSLVSLPQNIQLIILRACTYYLRYKTFELHVFHKKLTSSYVYYKLHTCTVHVYVIVSQEIYELYKPPNTTA